MDGGLMHDQTDETRARDACPSWCRRTHAAGLPADDQHHASAPRRVALVAGTPTLEPDELAVATAVIARLVRRTHSDVTWLEVVSEEGRDVRLVATLDTLRPLLAALQDLLSLSSV
jgi:hypothetical protein